jgi:DNA primase
MMTPEHIAELRRRFPLPRYFMAKGYKPKSKGRHFLMHCPFCIETGKTLRFRIYLDHFMCTAECGKRGDIIAAHAEIDGLSLIQAYEELCEMSSFNNSRMETLIPGAPVDLITIREIRRSQ